MSNVRYLRHAEREVGLREEIDIFLTDVFFVCYHTHSGGKCANQYEVIGCDAFAEITAGIGRKAYAHAISEVYTPGSAGGDHEQHPTFPVAGGRVKWSGVPNNGGSFEEPVDAVEELQIDLAGALLSCER